MLGSSHFEFIPEGFLAPPLFMGLLLILPLLLWRRQPKWHLWALLIPFSLVIPLVVDLTRNTTQIYHVRYAILASPAVYALLCTLSRRPWLSWTFRGLAFFAVITALPYAVGPYAVTDADFRGAGRTIDGHAGPNDAVLFAGADLVSALNHPRAMMLCESHEFTEPRDVVLLSGPVSPALDVQLRRYHHVYLSAFPGQPETLLPGWQVVRTFGTRHISAGSVYELAPPGTSAIVEIAPTGH